MYKSPVPGYSLLHELGKGQFGSVYKARRDADGEEFAIKVVEKKKLDETPLLKELFYIEVQVLTAFNHVNLLRCYEYTEDPARFYLITNYCNGKTLEDLVERRKYLKEPEALYYLKQILNGFAELQTRKVMHRDFKPANVMLHNDVVVIGDFGFAAIGKLYAHTYLGTPLFTAPEISSKGKEKPFYTSKVDIWAIGVTYYYMLFGQYPWEIKNVKELNHLVMELSGKDLFIPPEPEVSKDSIILLQRLIEKDPEKRISWGELFNHPIFNSKERSNLGTAVPWKPGQDQVNDDFEKNKKNKFVDDTSSPLSSPLKFQGEIPKEISNFFPAKPPAAPTNAHLVARVINRLHHEKRVLNFLYFTSIQLKHMAPGKEIEIKKYLLGICALLFKKVLVANSRLSEALFNEENHLNIPNFQLFLQSGQFKENLAKDILDDNSQLNKSRDECIQELSKHMEFSNDATAQIVAKCNLDNPKQEELSKSIRESLLLVVMDLEMKQNMMPPKEYAEYRRLIVCAWLGSHMETKFPYEAQNGTFNWPEFEANFANNNSQQQLKRDEAWIELVKEIGL